MKKYRRSRDDGRFALTTLQNPNLEVRSLPQLIAAAQNLIAEQEAAWKAGPASSELRLSTGAQPTAEEQATPADDAPAEAPPIVTESLATDATLPQNPAPAPDASLAPAAPPAPNPAHIAKLSFADPRAHLARKPRMPIPSPRPPPQTHRSRTPRAQMRYLRESLSRHD